MADEFFDIGLTLEALQSSWRFLRLARLPAGGTREFVRFSLVAQFEAPSQDSIEDPDECLFGNLFDLIDIGVIIRTFRSPDLSRQRNTCFSGSSRDGRVAHRLLGTLCHAITSMFRNEKLAGYTMLPMKPRPFSQNVLSTESGRSQSPQTSERTLFGENQLPPLDRLPRGRYDVPST